MKYNIVLNPRLIEINQVNKPCSTIAWIEYHNIKSQFVCYINYYKDLEVVEYILKHLNIKYEVKSNNIQTAYYIFITYDEYQKLILLLKLEGEYKNGVYIFSFDIE